MGLGSFDEMCVDFLMIYPMPDLFKCQSGFNDAAREAWITQGKSEGYMTGEFLQSLTWNSEEAGAAEWYEKLWSDETYNHKDQSCTTINGVSHEQETLFENTDTSYAADIGTFTQWEAPNMCTTPAPTTSGALMLQPIFVVCALLFGAMLKK